MKSLHINSNHEQLYTVVHSPSKNSRANRKHAVVICSPITHEHDASYWALRQLAVRLAKHGFDVARFDYFATGNSSGHSQQLSIQACVQNIVDIGQHLVEYNNSEKLTYIGLRLGATLASMSAVKHPPDQLVLWDPVISGQKFFAELATMHKQYLDKNNRTESHLHTLGQECLGYPYPEGVLSELNSMHLEEIELPADISLSILTAPDTTEQGQFIDKAKSSGLQLQHEITTKDNINWLDIDIIEASILPGQSINQVCSILKDS